MKKREKVAETYMVRRLEQAKLLTDPFKLKLLERFAGVPATTKQVADRMGEKAPRLYRHVEALAEEGLLELVEEKPKRGTVERYYRTVAERFEVDPDLFNAAPGGEDGAFDMVRSLLRETESDLLRVLDRHREGDRPADELPVVLRFSLRGTPTEIQALRAKMDDWLQDCTALCGDDDSDDQVAWSGMLAFYPQPEED